jgi:H+/Cl- antiporter ClcA
MSFAAEKHYVSRVSVASNTFSIFISTAHHWNSALWPLQLYASMGLILGLVAFFSYMTQKSLRSDYYETVWWFYNTVIATVYVSIAGFFS